MNQWLMMETTRWFITDLNVFWLRCYDRKLLWPNPNDSYNKNRWVYESLRDTACHNFCQFISRRHTLKHGRIYSACFNDHDNTIQQVNGNEMHLGNKKSPERDPQLNLSSGKMLLLCLSHLQRINYATCCQATNISPLKTTVKQGVWFQKSRLETLCFKSIHSAPFKACSLFVCLSSLSGSFN